MQEKQLQEVLRQAFTWEKWLVYHSWNSRHSPAGFPDILAIKGRQLLVAELKREQAHPTPAQHQWLAAFAAVREVDVQIWRPSDLDTALQIIQGK